MCEKCTCQKRQNSRKSSWKSREHFKRSMSSLSGDFINQNHCIWKTINVLKAITVSTIIVPFISFKPATWFYWNRDKLKGVMIKLDLTKKATIFSKALDVTDENQIINRHIILLIQTKASHIIVHAGTNDSYHSTSREILNKFLNFKSLIQEKLPDC